MKLIEENFHVYFQFIEKKEIPKIVHALCV